MGNIMSTLAFYLEQVLIFFYCFPICNLLGVYYTRHSATLVQNCMEPYPKNDNNTCGFIFSIVGLSFRIHLEVFNVGFVSNGEVKYSEKGL